MTGSRGALFGPAGTLVTRGAWSLLFDGVDVGFDFSLLGGLRHFATGSTVLFLDTAFGGDFGVACGAGCLRLGPNRNATEPKPSSDSFD